MKSFLSSIRLDNRNMDSYYYLGESYYGSRDYDKAKQVLSMIIRDAPSYEKLGEVNSMLKKIGMKL